MASKARFLADLLESDGDVVSDALDNVTSGDWNTTANKPTLAASALTDTTDADNITSGTMNVNRLGSSACDSSKYLRGDGTWVTNCTNHGNCTTNGSANCANCDGYLSTVSGSVSGNNKTIYASTNNADVRINTGSNCNCACACNC